MATLTDSATLWRVGGAAAVLLAMLLWERWAPRRPTLASNFPRWRDNFSLGVIDALIVRVMAPAGLVGIALWTAQNNLGLMGALAVDPRLRLALEFVILDLAIYWQHRLLHACPTLWRLHRTHHLDTHLDTTSGLRFHPAEIVASWIYKAVLVVTLGISPAGVVIFEIALNLFALYTHANIRLPWDRLARRFIVTPDMHRIHHSVEQAEQDSNFSNIFSFWDRLFGSYSSEPRSGQIGMTLGVGEARSRTRRLGVSTLLKDPILPS